MFIRHIYENDIKTWHVIAIFWRLQSFNKYPLHSYKEDGIFPSRYKISNERSRQENEYN